METLRQDIDNPYLEEKMFEEDEYLKALTERDNQISFLQDKYEKTSEQLEKTSEQLDIERKLNQEKDLELDNKAIKINQLQIEFAKSLKENGMSIEAIVNKTGLTFDEIGKL
jgi:predicted RNase H-like nuclease (RuvC/YqgF family)